MRTWFILLSILALAAIGAAALFSSPAWLWALALVLPLVFVGIHDMIQTRHALLRNFPILGHGRYLAEWARPKLYQYFVESDTNGRPFNRIDRSMIYQRAKHETDTQPFGTQLDLYAEGYEWIHHSLNALDKSLINQHPTIQVGGPKCTQPYELSIFNVSAMSFGSLSKNAVLALNKGARLGNFAQNTGEGGIAPYHLEHGGDLIYQVGTGYFGCRAKDGRFDPIAFEKTVQAPSIKMIELKLSQGAKPGHGGILPGKKNTPEIAKIRGVEAGTTVDSPPFHRSFNTPKGLLALIDQMRTIAGGRPVGFKLCIGHKHEFLSICKAMVETGIYPDFITIDGAEGGTGAAPVEFADHVGMPFKEALAFAHDALVGFGLRKDIKILTAGRIVCGYDIFHALCLGADACYSARAMMMALGCIQALECNLNTCPTGVATQREDLVMGLDVADKGVRVFNYHERTVESFVELLAATGLKDASLLNRRYVSRRVFMDLIKRFDELYPYLEPNVLLQEDRIPSDWKDMMAMASADRF